jgi:hypothetical protein
MAFAHQKIVARTWGLLMGIAKKEKKERRNNNKRRRRS